MDLRPTCLGWLGVVALALAPSGRSIKPHPSAFRMANMADRVVEGRLLEDGRVEVIHDWFAAPGTVAAKQLTVPSLAAMPRVPFDWGKGETEPIRVDSVVLFLVAGEDGGWEPVHLLQGRARGVLWIAGEAVWGYSQLMNPGPYVLTPWDHLPAEPVRPARPAEVRAEITAGLAARSLWQQALAIEDAQARAEAVAKWFSPATSPDGEHWQERWWPDLQDAVRALGEPIVQPLAGILADDPNGAAADLAARALRGLPVSAQGAVPAAITRLRDLRGARAVDVLWLLRAAPDGRAIDALREFLATASPYEAAEAGLALFACGDAQAWSRLAARVPNVADGEVSVRSVVTLLDALHAIEPVATERLVRTRFAQAEAVLAELRWLHAQGR